MGSIDPIRFSAPIRYWNVAKSSGLAVADIPGELIPAFGGLRQQRVHGTIGGKAFTSNVMPAGGGRLAISVSTAMRQAAGCTIGDAAEFEVISIGRD